MSEANKPNEDPERTIKSIKERIEELRAERRQLADKIKEMETEASEEGQDFELGLEELKEELAELSIELERELKSLSAELQTHMQELGDRIRRQVKNVTIRGLDADVYRDFASLSKSLGKNIGEVVTSLMDSFLAEQGATRTFSFKAGGRTEEELLIEDMDYLKITNKDLVTSKRKVRFDEIKELVFSEDVEFSAFDKFVVQISDCDTVRFPETLPKLLAISKCKDCENIEFYETDFVPIPMDEEDNDQ